MKIKLVLLTLLLSTPVFAQMAVTNLPAVYQPAGLIYTNGFADNATNATPSAPLDCTRYDQIGWQITKQLSGTGTATDYFDFECSLDNTNWPGTYFMTVALVANGTSTVQTNFDMNIGAQGFVRLSRARFGSNSGHYPTNILVIYTPKPYLR